MQIVLFEDGRTEDLWPVVLARPVMTLRVGGTSALKLAQPLGDQMHAIVRPYLAEIAARHLPPKGPLAAPVLFVNAAIVPKLSYRARLRELTLRGTPTLWTCGEQVSAAWLPAQTKLPEDLRPDNNESFLRDAATVAEDADLALLRYPHDIVRQHCDIFETNLQTLIEEKPFRQMSEGMYIEDNVEIARTAVLDAADGPIVLEEGVRIGEFAYVSGPAYIGRQSRLIHGAAVKDGTAIAHVCKIGGEVERSTFMPYANKQHHGFIGHAYVGSWVNMGAGTSDSDLKNTYGDVRVEHRGERIETGMQFLGCAIGDFSKTAINTSIFTGKIIGVASMVYGLVARNVPSFCNWAMSFGQVTECPPEVSAATQKRMFARRNVVQTETDVQLLRDIFRMTRHQRLIASEPPQL